MSGLHLEGLHIARGDFRLQVETFSVPPGTAVGIVGRSGSGKTTLLEAIAGFLPVSSGSIRVDGKSIEKLPPEQRRIALVFQKPSLFSHLNVEDNIGFGLRFQNVGKPERKMKSAEWLERMGLAGMGARNVHEISEGQAQRVALARALAVGFPVLLLDEPFSALDSQTRLELRELIRRLVAETRVSAVFVSHHEEDVKALTQKVLRLEGGKAFSV